MLAPACRRFATAISRCTICVQQLNIPIARNNIVMVIIVSSLLQPMTPLGSTELA
jgi:hypothetical protein